MRQQAMSEKMLYGRPIPVARIVQGISDSASQSLARLHLYKAMHGPGECCRCSCSRSAEAQMNTQQYGRRPYGVGFLVIGQDVSAAWLHPTRHSGSSHPCSLLWA